MLAALSSAVLQYFQDIAFWVSLVCVDPDGSSRGSRAVVFEANSKRKRPNCHFDLLVSSGPAIRSDISCFGRRANFLSPIANID